MNSKFAENLKKNRKDNNLSQEELAEKLGVTRQAISKWESAGAYPEMDKILFLCQEFNLNIDDLLSKDIRESKGEEETKKYLNKAFDEFFKFITDSINLFSSMPFKSKLKCLLEQGIIITILIIIAFLLDSLGAYLVSNLFGFMPLAVYRVISAIFQSLFIILIVIIGICILVRIFKARYLDYYYKIKNDANDKQIISEDIDTSTQDIKSLKLKKENKVIIRDPKNSEYHFINIFIKIIIYGIKFFAFEFACLFSIILVMMVCMLVLSFLIMKTGIFFIGLLLFVLAGCVIDIIILFVILNFIFNRKSPKKMMLHSFVISLVVLGISLGLIFWGSLDFELQDNVILKEQTTNIAMNDNLFLDLPADIKYVEENISDVKITYKINKYSTFNYHISDNNGVYGYLEYHKPMKIIKDIIKNFNDKKIVSFDSNLRDVVVYASKENIEILKNNKLKFLETRKAYEQDMENYENLIEHYERQINQNNLKINEYQEKINDLENQIIILKEKDRE